MKNIHGIVFLSLFLFACKKTDSSLPGKNLESFAFSGVVTNCITGKPVKNTRIKIEAYWDSMLFGRRVDVGETRTDQNGYYSINPKKLDDYFEEYIITYYYPNGFSMTEYVALDSIRRKPADKYILNFKVIELGYVKLNFSNVNQFDTSDVLHLNFYQNPVECTYNPPILVSDPKPIHNSWFKGIIKSGYIYRSAHADDSLRIDWKVVRNGDTAEKKSIYTYVRISDTTVINLEY